MSSLRIYEPRTLVTSMRGSSVLKVWKVFKAWRPRPRHKGPCLLRPDHPKALTCNYYRRWAPCLQIQCAKKCHQRTPVATFAANIRAATANKAQENPGTPWRAYCIDEKIEKQVLCIWGLAFSNERTPTFTSAKLSRLLHFCSPFPSPNLAW